MTEKKFKLKPEEIKELTSLSGYSYVSDKITVEGMQVGFMYREKPFDKDDSGWRFLSGTETEEYLDDTNNSMIFDVNTVANYDQAIIPYLKSRVGSELERVEGGDDFQEI
ncbi:MAG: DUF2185 domain-containing protein [Bacteroidota bacterium]